MQNGLVVEVIRARARMSLLFAMTAGAAAAVTWWWVGPTLLGSYLPAEPVDLAAMAAVRTPSEVTQTFVTVNRGDAHPLGLQRITKTTRSGSEVSRTTTDFLCVAYPLPDSADRKHQVGVLVIEGSKAQGGLLSGRLKPLEAEVRLRIQPELDQEGITVAPVMLDTVSDRVGWWMGGVAWAAVVLFGLWHLRLALSGIAAPASHPIHRSLRKWGDPAEVAAAIDASAGSAIVRNGSRLLTSDWLIIPGWTTARIVRLDDLGWIHQKTVEAQGGTTYAAVLNLRDGRVVEVPANESAVQALLATIASLRPWLLVGYDARLEALWRTSREQLLAVLHERRRRVLAGEPLHPPDDAEDAGKPADPRAGALAGLVASKSAPEEARHDPFADLAMPPGTGVHDDATAGAKTPAGGSEPTTPARGGLGRPLTDEPGAGGLGRGIFDDDRPYDFGKRK